MSEEAPRRDVSKTNSSPIVEENERLTLEALGSLMLAPVIFWDQRRAEDALVSLRQDCVQQELDANPNTSYQNTSRRVAVKAFRRPDNSYSHMGWCSWHYRACTTGTATNGHKYDVIAQPPQDHIQRDAMTKVYVNRMQFIQPIKIFIESSPTLKKDRKKVMVVLSTGCPEQLSDFNLMQRLLWAHAAGIRRTYMLVHSSELDIYRTKVKSLLDRLDVGLVSWNAGDVVGFGMSRRAAQELASKIAGDIECFLCDHNVLHSAEIIENCKTDSEEDSEEETVPGTEAAHLCGMGTGQSKALSVARRFAQVDLSLSNSGLESPVRPSNAGSLTGRPIEQVVKVHPKFPYDPCFITGSEDRDLTVRFLLGKTEMEIIRSKKSSPIKKIAFSNNASTKYEGCLIKYLNQLGEFENQLSLTYERSCKELGFDSAHAYVTLSELSSHLARVFQRPELRLRSLIIEKFLLTYKEYCYQRNLNPLSGATAAQPTSAAAAASSSSTAPIFAVASSSSSSSRITRKGPTRAPTQGPPQECTSKAVGPKLMGTPISQ